MDGGPSQSLVVLPLITCNNVKNGGDDGSQNKGCLIAHKTSGVIAHKKKTKVVGAHKCGALIAHKTSGGGDCSHTGV